MGLVCLSETSESFLKVDKHMLSCGSLFLQQVHDRHFSIPFISGAFSNTAINPISVMKSSGGSVEKIPRKNIEKHCFSIFKFVTISFCT